jgi:hypothetical protein
VCDRAWRLGDAAEAMPAAAVAHSVLVALGWRHSRPGAATTKGSPAMPATGSRRRVVQGAVGVVAVGRGGPEVTVVVVVAATARLLGP